LLRVLNYITLYYDGLTVQYHYLLAQTCIYHIQAIKPVSYCVSLAITDKSRGFCNGVLSRSNHYIVHNMYTVIIMLCFNPILFRGRGVFLTEAVVHYTSF
jgi:hypothetical protein